MPRDGFRREIDYLRISVIDRCNLRCTYCMPLEGLRFAPSPELLTPEEIARLARAAVDVGFRRFRITGGEPLIRRDLEEIVAGIRAVEGAGEISMTTNAVLLPEVAESLAEAGLNRVNIHLDTTNPERLRQVMRFNDLDKVWRGIEAAEAAGLTPLKLNTVVVRGINERDVVELAALTLEHDWHVRFIELMPLGGGECAQYSRDQYVPNALTRGRIEKVMGTLESVPNRNPSDESRNFRIAGAQGIVGFISPVSEPFCGTCNRMRITSTGNFHLCLLHDDEVNVKDLLRGGGSDEEIRNALLRAVGEKPSGHDLLEGISSDVRSMYQIGG